MSSEVQDIFHIDPFSVMIYWITPFIQDPSADPTRIEATLEDGNVILRWEPALEAFFYSY